MEILHQIVLFSFSAAENYYVWASAILLSHCIFDEGIVWNKKKKRLCIALAIFDEVVSGVCQNIVGISIIFLYYYLNYNFIRKGIVVPFRKRERWLFALYLLFIFALYSMVIVSNTENEHFAGRMVQVATAVLAAVSGLGLPVFLFKNRVSSYYRDMKEYQETFMQAELSYFQQYREKQEETRRFRHDIRNNLNCIHMLLKEQKEKEAEQYLEGLLQDISSLSPEIITGDEMLDCIFSAKYSLMKQQDIVLELDGVLEGGLRWKPIDICSVFANALDNAIEECMRIPEGHARQIRVSFKHTGGYFYVGISNTAAQNIDCGKLERAMGTYTSKKNKNLHGYGLQNIRRTVTQYGGMVKIECKDRFFVLSLVIKR